MGIFYVVGLPLTIYLSLRLTIQVRGFHREDSEDDSDDEFSDDEELQTPIDEVDPFIFFVDTIQGNYNFPIQLILVKTSLRPKLTRLY